MLDGTGSGRRVQEEGRRVQGGVREGGDCKEGEEGTEKVE